MHMARILIVDDEQMIREVVREYALINGYEVAEASDGLEALELVEKEDFDCVILDIMMPKLDGFSACKQIKKIKPIPIIMLSARQEEYDKLFGFELGVDDYVVKPFSPKELMARVKVILERFKTKDTEVLRFEGLQICLLYTSDIRVTRQICDRAVGGDHDADCRMILNDLLRAGLGRFIKRDRLVIPRRPHHPHAVFVFVAFGFRNDKTDAVD